MIKHFVAAALVAASFGSAAGAATFSGSTYGNFLSNNISGGDSDKSTNSCRFSTGGGSNNGVAWGDSGDCPDFSGDNQDSRIWIEKFSFSEDVTGHEVVQIGQINWYNAANPSTIAKDFTAFGKIFLKLTSPTTGTFEELLAFAIENTLNPTADEILAYYFNDFGLDVPVLLSEDLRLDGFSFALKGYTHGEDLDLYARRDGLKLDWTNKENNLSQLAIFAKVSHVEVNPIPLPAAAWLLLAGVGGLVAVGRRKAA